MRNNFGVWAATLVTLALLTAAGLADVVVRGPLGGLIVVGSPTDVQVGPGGVAVVPGPVVQPPGPPLPPPQVMVPVQQPVLVTPVYPQDFVKTFRPQPGAYRVVFVHPRTNQPVTVAFELPPGHPWVTYFGHCLVFDYGLHEVAIRFQIGGGVKVMQR